MSTPYKNAVDVWKDSNEWLDCNKPETLHAPSRMREFLENRLLRAFEAGWKAREATGELPDNGS